MSAAPRPTLVDSRRQFWWGEHELIDYGVPARIGTSAWTVYTCLLRHVNAQAVTFPSVKLLMAETGLSNRVIAASISGLRDVSLIDVDRESHQWNVYRVLDVLHAIRKNGWQPIKEEARDEKSPAQQSGKHVTKSHVARDEKSPEHVTKSHTKKNQLKRTKRKRGGESDLESDPRESGQPSTPVAELSSATHSSSKTPAAETPTHEAGPLATIVGAALASMASVPTAAVLEAPDGVAAIAAVAGLQDSQEIQDQPRAGMNQQTTSTEEVPAAAGEGAARPGNGAGSPGVDSLRPVDAQTLAARPVMPPEGPAYKALRSLVGKSLPEMLLEKTRTGQLPRGELWLRLELGEIELVRVTAQAEAKATQTSMITLAVRGLDHLIGAKKAPKASTGKAMAAASSGVPVTGPQDLAHVDPQLVPGQRCTVGGKLGVIALKMKPEYTVLLDDGERVLVDRHVASQLQSLRPSDAPHPDVPAAAPQTTVPVQVPVGTAWRPKSGGDVVRVTAVAGTNRTLSNGATVAFYTLMTSFEQVQA